MFHKIKVLLDAIANDSHSGLVHHSSLKINKLLDELRETYAKPVYMTQEQKGAMMFYLEHSSLGAFFDAMLSLENKNDVRGLFERSDLSDEDIARAWLHPDVIKEVE
jgi:hypothetical protein